MGYQEDKAALRENGYSLMANQWRYVVRLLKKVTFYDVIDVTNYGAEGDGVTDDTDAVVDAITAAGSGGSVYFPFGTYLINEIDIPSNITLFGNNSIIKGATNQNYIFTLTGTEDITIRDLTFDCSGLLDTAIDPLDSDGSAAIYRRQATAGSTLLSNLIIRNCKFTGIKTSNQNYHAVVLGGVNKGVVADCYIPQSGGDAFNFNNTGTVLITENCIIENSGDGGIAYNNGARGTISNNYLYKCSLGVGCGPEGLAGTDKEHTLIVANNTFDSCNYGVLFGYFGYAGRPGPANWAITGNNFKYCKIASISYAGETTSFVANGTISGNTIVGTGDDAYDGAFNGTTAYDIFLSLCGMVSITGNTMYATAGTATTYGIYLNQSSNCNLASNVIKGDVAARYDYGIIITDSTACAINANTIEHADGGIRSDGTVTTRNITITDNHVLNWVGTGISLAGTTPTNCHISGNTVISSYNTTNNSQGISLSANSQYISVTNNTLKCQNGTIAPSAGIAVNAAGTANYYNVSYNVCLNYPAPQGVVDGGPGGSTKNVVGNWSP